MTTNYPDYTDRQDAFETVAVIDWKSRYSELLEHSEKLERRSERRQQLLVAGFLSALQLTRGLSESLDTRLLATQNLLKDPRTRNVDLDQTVSSLQRAAKGCVEKRAEDFAEVKSNLVKLSKQTRALKLSADLKASLKQFERRLKQEKSDLAVLTAVSGFLPLHKQAVQAAKLDTGGWWRRWSGERNKPSEVAEQPDTDTPDTEAKLSISNVMRSSGLFMLNQLSDSERGDALKASIVNGLDAENFTQSLDELCNLAAETIHDERLGGLKDQQRLGSRLADSINQLDACVSQNDLAKDSVQVFQQSVAEGLVGMEESVSQATSLEDLKQTMGTQLQGLAQALATHQDTYGEVTGLTQLSKQLTHMQDMQRAAVFRMDEQLKTSLLDEPTGLPNRLALYQDAGAWLDQLPCCLAFCQINSSSGDPQLQCAVAEHLAALKQPVFCFAISQFVVALPGVTLQDAAAILDQKRQEVARAESVTLTIGIAAATGSDTIQSLLARTQRLSSVGANQTHLAP